MAKSAKVTVTETSLKKKIVDATKKAQRFLDEHGIHDFVQQEPGSVVIEATAQPSGEKCNPRHAEAKHQGPLLSSESVAQGISQGTCTQAGGHL